MIFFFIYLPNKMGENKYCRNCSKIQLKNRKRGKTYNHNTQIHDCSLPWLGTGTSMY